MKAPLTSPLAFAPASQGSEDYQGYWLSGEWPLRRKNVFLMPGDSPAGLRLPLDSLPWVAPEKREPFYERDQFDALPELENRLYRIGGEARDFPKLEQTIRRPPTSRYSAQRSTADGTARPDRCDRLTRHGLWRW